ncbi:hypothetical protein A9Q81_13245 [Gammaproteobacteria bacterium 42_54_T18]|nr:hypothetical protein A9Q81_13245 [Gammaproteobacteria bacterium 42_54_T18]
MKIRKIFCLLAPLLLPSMSVYSAVDLCNDGGGLEQIVKMSYKNYNEGQFQQANRGVSAGLETIIDALVPLTIIPENLPNEMTYAAASLNMSICQEAGDLLYIYPHAPLKSERPPVSILWRVGEIAIPGDRPTFDNPVDPLFFQAPHFEEGRPVAVKLMRETKAKVMVLAANDHKKHPNYMNAARGGSSRMHHVFLDVNQHILEKYPQVAVMVLHGMRRKEQRGNAGWTSGMIQPGEGGGEMSANRQFQLKSFSSLFAAEMAKALDVIPGVDPRLKTELRAPNGKALGLADLNGFLFSVNTDQVNGFSTAHINRLQAIHFEIPQRMRYRWGYMEPTQDAFVLAMNNTMENYKREPVFATSSTVDYCNRHCRRNYFKSRGVTLYSLSKFKGKESIIPIIDTGKTYYNLESMPSIASIKFPSDWEGSITLYDDTEGQGYFETFSQSDSNIWDSELSKGALSASADIGSVEENPISIVTLEAEGYDQKRGSIRIERKGDTTNLGYIRTDDWVKYSSINFGSTGVDTFDARIATSRANSYGRIEVYLDELSGAPVGTFTGLSGQGGWSKFKIHSIELDQTITGTHDLYLKFKSGYNLDWFRFSSK